MKYTINQETKQIIFTWESDDEFYKISGRQPTKVIGFSISECGCFIPERMEAIFKGFGSMTIKSAMELSHVQMCGNSQCHNPEHSLPTPNEAGEWWKQRPEIMNNPLYFPNKQEKE